MKAHCTPGAQSTPCRRSPAGNCPEPRRRLIESVPALPLQANWVAATASYCRAYQCSIARLEARCAEDRQCAVLQSMPPVKLINEALSCLADEAVPASACSRPCCSMQRSMQMCQANAPQATIHPFIHVSSQGKLK